MFFSKNTDNKRCTSKESPWHSSEAPSHSPPRVQTETFPSPTLRYPGIHWYTTSEPTVEVLFHSMTEWRTGEGSPQSTSAGVEMSFLQSVNRRQKTQTAWWNGERCCYLCMRCLTLSSNRSPCTRTRCSPRCDKSLFYRSKSASFQGWSGHPTPAPCGAKQEGLHITPLWRGAIHIWLWRS